MNIKKNVILSLASLACVGVLAGASSTASGANCGVPILPAAGSLALLPTNIRASVSCAGNGSAAMESVGTASGSAVSARLVTGVDASTAGYRSDRTRINTCLARDTSTADGAKTSPGSCAGAVFKDMLVFN